MYGIVKKATQKPRYTPNDITQAGKKCSGQEKKEVTFGNFNVLCDRRTAVVFLRGFLWPLSEVMNAFVTTF